MIWIEGMAIDLALVPNDNLRRFHGRVFFYELQSSVW